MINRIALLIVTFVGIFLFSCKSSKTYHTATYKNHITDTILDSNRLSFYKGDTLSYINYITKNQGKYIGKPLSSLLSDLDIPINTFYYSPNPNNRYRITNLILETKPFNIPPRIINGVNQDFEIGIGWQTYIPTDSVNAIVSDNGAPNYYKWSKKAQQYFGKQIIGNLWLRNYLKKWELNKN